MSFLICLRALGQVTEAGWPQSCGLAAGRQQQTEPREQPVRAAAKAAWPHPPTHPTPSPHPPSLTACPVPDSLTICPDSADCEVDLLG